MNKLKFSKYNLLFTVSLFALILLTGCTFLKGLNAIYNKDVKPKYITYKDKSVILTPLTHFGQAEFYDSLKDSIVQWKKLGYVIFYEGIMFNPAKMEVDSTTADVTMRMWRKLSGGLGITSEDYAKVLNGVFKNKIGQPEYKELGIDSADFRTDITLVVLVSEFEKLYGSINLDSCDYATHLDSTYTCGKKLKGNRDPIFIAYRNKYVVEQVIKSDQKRIVVLYGARHMKGMRKLLKDDKLTN